MSLPFLCDASSSDDDITRPSRVAAARWLVLGDDAALEPLDPAEAGLVARLRTGDVGAFRELWDRYHVRLADFAFRYVRSHDAAADVVQDVFIALWERHEQVAPRG